MYRKKPCVALLFWLALSGQLLLAQLTTATISGTAKDETEAILPGATITIRNLDTGITRTVITDSEGRYRAANLSLGNYEVTASLAGFQTAVRSGIKLTVGREAVVDFTMKVGEITEKLVVTGEAPLVNVTDSVIGGLVDDRAVRELPLNGRSFIELATLQAGVAFVPFGEESASQGFGKKITISGSRFTSNLFLLDGTVMNDSYNSAGSAAGGVLTGVETIREFTVISNAYSAEYGRHTGGVVNAVTRSGTNEFHGSAFEFLRNDNLDARNFFDRDPQNPSKRSDPPEFKRNQFGFALGGPIAKDKSFFFGSYEGLRERLGLTQIFNVPSEAARRGFLPDPKTGQLRFVGVDPKVEPFLRKIYPPPNGRDFGDGRAELIRSASRRTSDDYFTARADHRFSDSDSLFGRYTFDDASRLTPSNINARQDESTRSQFLTLAYDRIFSPALINRFNFGFSRTLLFAGSIPFPGLERVTFTSSPVGFGALDVGGLGATGGGATDPRLFITNSFQYKDDTTYVKGRHSLKFGMSFERLQHNLLSPRQPAGQFIFESLGDLLANRPQEARLATLENFDRHVRQNLVGLYLQDDFKLLDNLTLNLGVRYEFITVPVERAGRTPQALGARFFDPKVTPKDIVVGNPYFLNPSLTNFAPRLGFAWDPFGNGKTSVRGGVGIFYEQLMFWTYRMALLHTAPLFLEGRLRSEFVNIDFPNAFFTQFNLIRDAPRYESVEFDPSQPYLLKYSLEIQRELISDLAIKVGYSASRGVHLGRQFNINGRVAQVLPDGRLFFSASAPVNNPNFGRARHRVFDGTSDYHSLRLEVNKRLSAGLQFQGSYTLSKATDDGTSITGSTDFSNEDGSQRHFTIKDHALSAIDVRHNFTFNFVYDLPGKRLGGSLGNFVGGWSANGIVRLSSGNPFSVETGFDRSRIIEGVNYPNLVAGRSNNPIRPGNPDQYYDPTAFELPPAGFLGNLGRNTLTAPGVAAFDFSLTKNIHVAALKSEGMNLQFRAEFFNLFNRANFGLPERSVFDRRTLLPRPTAGRITDTITTSRQIQFGLKVMF